MGGDRCFLKWQRFAKQNVIALTVIALLILYVFMASICWLVAPLISNDFRFPDDWQLIFTPSFESIFSFVPA